MPTIWVFDHIEDKQTFRGKHCMKRFFTSLKEHSKSIIDFDFEKKKMLPLTKEELKSHQDASYM